MRIAQPKPLTQHLGGAAAPSLSRAPHLTAPRQATPQVPVGSAAATGARNLMRQMELAKMLRSAMPSGPRTPFGTNGGYSG